MKTIPMIILILICAYGTLNKANAQTSVPHKSNSSSDLNIQINKVINDFENALNEEANKMPPLFDNIHAVKKNMETLKTLLRTELKNTDNFKIDFIPQYELVPKAQIESWAHDSIERYQRAVRNYLTEAGYDLVGWEATALEKVTHESYEQELMNNWKEADSSIRIDATNLFIRFASQYMWQDGVLAYWAINPNAKLIGLEETSLWRLNIKSNEFDIPFSYYVAEFRSYVAMAKMIKAIRENKAKQTVRAVIVMGAWHQSDITSIAKALGVKLKIINVTAKDN